MHPKVIELGSRALAVDRASPEHAEGASVLIPRDKLITDDGHVRWPAAAPSGTDFKASREAADSAVQACVQEFLNSGTVSIRSLVEARNKLALFASPALEKFRSDSPADAIGFEVFLQSLDAALNGLIESNPR
jgi:hypothetical protein